MRGPSVALAASLAVAIGALAGGCDRSTATTAPARRAFYWWRSTFTPSLTERSALSALGVERVYLHVFDVDSGPAGPRPVANVSFGDDGAALPGIEIVPVVFVREDVLRHVSPAGTSTLATNVWREVERAAERGRFSVGELQVDCDWTDGTRARYFELLRALKQMAGPSVVLSSTIRLHQVKYRERTGVPPVDRGVLMFYNMGTIGAPLSGTSIFDPESASKYLARLPEYPLPLDLALPIWSWTLHLRDGRVEGLLQSTDPSELEIMPGLRKIAPDRWEATETTFVRGAMLRSGDVLAGETTRPEDTRAALELVAPLLPPLPKGSAPRTVTLFDLSEKNLARHDPRSLDHVFRSVH